LPNTSSKFKSPSSHKSLNRNTFDFSYKNIVALTWVAAMLTDFDL